MRYVEFFDRDFNFISQYPVADFDLSNDYIVQSNSSITLQPNALMFSENYARIKGLYNGVVSSYTLDRDKTTVSLKPLLSLFDVTIEMDVSELASMDCESWIEKYILMWFNGSDTYQNLKGITIYRKSSTAYDADNNACISVNDNNIYNLMDVIIDFFRYYGICLDTEINPQSKKLTVTMRNIYTETPLTIRTDIPDVISCTFSTSNNSRKYNKIRYINTGYKDGVENLNNLNALVSSTGTYDEAYQNDVSSYARALNSSYGGNAKLTIKDGTITVDSSNYATWLSTVTTAINGETKEITYYWHPSEYSGTIDTDATTDREIPVLMNTDTAKPTYEKKDSSGNVTTAYKSFADAAYEKAYKAMYRDKYSDGIDLSLRANGKVITEFTMGHPFKIIHEKITYYSILTGYERDVTGVYKLTFGVSRYRLSQLIKLSAREG